MKKKKLNKLTKNLLIISLIIFLLFMKKHIVYFFYNTNIVINEINFKIVSSKKLVLDRINLYKDRIESIKNYDANNNEIMNLRKKINLLETKILQDDELKRENYELREILKLPKKKYIDYIISEIILIDDLKKEGIIYINKGFKDEIEKDLPVLSEGRLVGKINRVEENYSEVHLIYNPDFKISVFVNENTKGILRGAGNSKIIIRNFNLEDAENIKKFTIKTSGFSEYFPKNIPIGTYLLKDNSKLIKERELELVQNINIGKLNTLVIYKYDKEKIDLINQIMEKEEK